MGRFDELFSLVRTHGAGDRRQFRHWACLGKALGMQGAELILVARRKDELAAAVRCTWRRRKSIATACPADLSTPAGLDGSPIPSSNTE